MESLVQDARFAFRWLRRSPGFALVAVLTLAIGIGFNTAIFSIVDAVLLRPLPVRAGNELVNLYTSGTDGSRYQTSSYPDYLDFKAKNAVFQDLAAYTPMFTAVTLGDQAKLTLGEVVSGNYFQMLGIRPALGRALLPSDDHPGAARVAVVSYQVLAAAARGHAGAIGRTIRLRGNLYSVVGVAPASFTGMFPLLSPDIWVPIADVNDAQPAGIIDTVPSPTGSSWLDRRGQRWLFLVGRRKAGVSVDQVQANLSLLMSQLATAYPQTDKDRQLSAVATSSVHIHPEADRILTPVATGLLVVVGLVLLIACANVASMLLARASARQREIGIRLAIGASRARLIRQLLTESLSLALVGGAAGVLLALGCVRLITTMSLPIPVPVSLDLRIDTRVLLFTLAVTMLAAVVAGLAPALRSTKADLVADLKGEAGAVRVGRRRWTLRDGLVAGQMAVTTLLLVVAALLVRGLIAAQQESVGFRTEGLAIVSTDSSLAGYDSARGQQLFDRILEKIQAMPGVESAAIASRLPFSLNFSERQVYVPGRMSTDDKGVTMEVADVSTAYFKTLGVPILEGRGFAATDTPDTPMVTVINETMARRYWPGEDPVGRTIRLRGPDGPVYQVIGVSADYKVSFVNEAPKPFVLFAAKQHPDWYWLVVARTHGNANALLGAMQRQFHDIDPRLVMMDHQTMDAQLGATLLPVRAGAWLAGLVGLIALLLASVGLYGVIAYSVARRTRELGIRMALGARPSALLGLVMRQGLGIAAIGLGVGCLLAAAAVRLLSGLLYGVSVADPLAWTIAAVALLAVAGLANLVPARRAARVDPSSALRTD